MYILIILIISNHGYHIYWYRYYYYKQSRYSDMIKSFAYMWFLCSSLEIKWAIGYDAKHGNKSLWIANNGFLMSLQNTYLPIFCIFHNSIRKSLCLIELALMHYTKKKDMNEHLGNILHFKYQPNNFSGQLTYQFQSFTNILSSG